MPYVLRKGRTNLELFMNDPELASTFCFPGFLGALSLQMRSHQDPKDQHLVLVYYM